MSMTISQKVQRATAPFLAGARCDGFRRTEAANLVRDALMKHAPILILDDSVSAVDTKTERTILDNLKNVRD